MAEYLSDQTLRILVISAREDIRDQVTDALQSWQGSQRLFWVAQPQLANTRASDVVPNVILVDDSLGHAAAISLIRELCAKTSGAVILALVEPEAIAQARQAVLAGARGFVTKPVQAEELVATLRQTLTAHRTATTDQESSEGDGGRIIVFCAPKGGTGRTTMAINTSVVLRQLSQQPLVLVDADYESPALDVALNLPAERTIADLMPRFSQLDEDLVSGVLAGHASGINVLLAPPPAGLNKPISLPQVQHILVVLRRLYPWVVVDLGLRLDETAYGFLDGADMVIMNVLPEMVGLRNTGVMLAELRERGLGREKIRLILNRSNMGGGISSHDIEERLRLHLSHQIPDDQPLATHSINRGVPLVISHPRSAVARAVTKLAEQLLAEMKPGSHDPSRSGGLLDRWFSW